MTTTLIRTNRNIILITVIALIIFTGGLALLHSVSVNIKDKVANGLMADLVITFPVLYYLIIVKPLKTSAKSMLVVISICSAVAYLVLPQHQRGYILQLRKLSALAELFFIIFAITKFNKLRTCYKQHQSILVDPVYNLRAAMADVLGDSLAVKIIASELAVLRYGLLLWKRERSGLNQSISFSTHKEANYIAVWCMLFVAVVVEITAFHLLLLKWSHLAAMIITALSLYGVIFIIADLSAMVKRKVQLNDEHLLLRTGLRWKVIIPLNNISSITKVTGDYHSEETYFKGGIIKTSGNVLISFKQPVKIDKLYGSGKTFGSILMNIDDYDTFANTLNSRNNNEIKC